MEIRQKEQKGLKRTVINWYNDVLIWLSNHKKIAFFLSHGGLHFLVLILCFVGAFFMYEVVQSYNQKELRQFSLRIEGDTLKNYKLTHVSIHYTKAELEGKDLDKIDYDVEGFNYHFKYEKRVNSLRQLKLLKCNVPPYDTLDVDLIQRINLTVDNPSFLKLINSSEIVTNPQTLDSHHTSKFNSNYITNETNSVHLHGFTSEDSIKEDEFKIMLPNLTNDWKGDNPYYCCFFGFHAVPGTYNLDSTSRIRIQYNKYPYKEGPNHYDTEYDLFPEAPMVIESVFPTPTEITLENIIYDGKDVEKVFEQGGVYVTAVEPVKKAHANRMEFLWTVIIGVTLAFALDIIVQLILKWRKLKCEK